MKTEKDLVWLVWNGSGRFPTLMKEAPENVAVDITNGSWTLHGQAIKFGRAVEHPWGKEGTPLGAYERTNFYHLQNILADYRRLAPPLTASMSLHRS